ncbi:MAG: M28 family peptidase [Thermodesulfobacteriota bacterium]
MGPESVTEPDHRLSGKIKGGPPAFGETTLVTAILLCCLVTMMLPAAGRAAEPSVPLAADTGRIRETIAFLAGLDPPRNFRQPASLGQAAAFIRHGLTVAGCTVCDQPFVAGGRTYLNLSARLGPAGAPRLVVGAHYDVAGNTPGADDNASGVAGLLELAHLLKPREQDLAVELELVAYCLEEPPFFATDAMGSVAHARALKAAGVPVRGMISLECIGFFNDAPGSQDYPSPILAPFYPDTGNFIALVGNLGSSGLVRDLKHRLRSAGVPVEALVAPGWWGGIGLSDHRSYWQEGYQAVMLTDTAFFRNPHYHQPSDTPGTLDLRRLGLVISGLARALLTLT